MKRSLLWISLFGLGLLALSCAPAAAPGKPASDSQTRAVAPAPPESPNAALPPQEGRAADSQAYSSSGLAAPPKSAAAAAKPAEAKAGEVAGAPVGGVFDRMIIYAAQTSMEVKDVTQSLDDIANLAVRQNGFVVSSNFRFEGERKVATITIKVPALVYQATLAELRRLAIKVEDENTKSQDVTEEFSDLDSQLRNLRATEDRYLDLLKRANTIDEILKVQARIDETRRQIDRIRGRMDYLDKTSEMASITISLFSKDSKVLPKPETGGWWKTPGEAWEQSLLFLGRIVSTVAIGVAFFWWAIILIATAAILSWRSLRKVAGSA